MSHLIYLPLISHIAIFLDALSWSLFLNMSAVALAVTASLKGLKKKAFTDITQISFFSRQELLSVPLALNILFQSLRQRNHKPQNKVLWHDSHTHVHTYSYKHWHQSWCNRLLVMTRKNMSKQGQSTFIDFIGMCQSCSSKNIYTFILTFNLKCTYTHNTPPHYLRRDGQ